MMVATALLTANYSIKTGFGISEGTYSSTGESQPNHGPAGPGSGLPLALWMIVSCVCFSVMLKVCHGMSLFAIHETN